MRSAKLAVCCLVVPLLLILGTSAHAGKHPALSVSAGGGWTYPTGNYGSFYDTGRHLSGMVGFDFGVVPLRLRVKGAYFKMNEPGGALGAPRYDGSFKGTGVLAELAWTFPTRTRFKPYIFTGAGEFDVTVKHSDSVEGTEYEYDDSEGVLSFGGGTDIKFGQFGMFAEWSYYHIMTTPGLNFHQLTLGASFGIPL